MSLHRFIACQRLKLSPKNVNIVRWQSSNAAPKGGGAIKMITIGVATTGLAAGGSLIYANYNPVFKNQVNETIPGFSKCADKSADLWVSMTEYFNPKPKSGVVASPDKVQQRLEEQTKTNTIPVVKNKKDPETAKDIKSLRRKSDIKGTEQVKDGGRKEERDDTAEAMVSRTSEAEMDSKQLTESGASLKDLKDSETVASEKSKLFPADATGTKSDPSPALPESGAPAIDPLPESDMPTSDLSPASDVSPTSDLSSTKDTLSVGDSLPTNESLILTQPSDKEEQPPSSSAVPFEPTEEPLMLSEDEEKAEKIISEVSNVNTNLASEQNDKPVSSLNKEIEVLERQLKDLEIKHAQELKEELEEQRKSLDASASEALEYVLEESEEKHQQNLAAELNEMSSKYNDILREQFRLEEESHAIEMDRALKSQADQLNSKWSSEMDLKLSEKEGHYQIELAKSRARLGGLERTVDIVAVAGEKTFHLQRLRNSCDSLITSFEDMDINSDITDRRTFGTELKSLRTAADRDPFIVNVLDSIPQKAVDGEGIQSKASLGERFRRVKRVCRRVALVPETGGGIGTYALSYIQSALTLNAWFPGEKMENNEPDSLHTFDLLHLAEAKLKKGDLEGAVHYMNHLQGEPRRVARDWMADARSYLETRQAIQLVQTYMSANAITSSNQ